MTCVNTETFVAPFGHKITYKNLSYYCKLAYWPTDLWSPSWHRQIRLFEVTGVKM